MPGNFDFPPASSSTGDDMDNLPPQLQRLRQALRRDREHYRTAREAAAADRHTLQSNLLMSPSTRAAPRRRRPSSARSPVQLLPSQEPRDASPSPHQPRATDDPPSVVRSRPRATPGDRYQRLRGLRQQLEDADNSLVQLAEAGERLSQANAVAGRQSSSVAALLDLAPPSRRPRADSGSPQRTSKRRKLGHDTSQALQPFRYGHYGQVVPGRLKMEIVSCDGGEFSDSYSTMYRAENVLRDDRSVYCTKTSRCNLLLRHRGETTFCLQRIVIKAPERGFTAPLQEGMIFISMDSDSLLESTSHYEIRYNPPYEPSSSPDASRDRERLTLLESLRDPGVLEGSRRLRERNDELYAAMARRELLAEARRSRNRDESESAATTLPNLENCDWPPPPPPPFTVTTETDDESDAGEDESSAAVLADRSRRDARWPPESDSDDDGDDELAALNSFWEARGDYRALAGPGYARAVRRSTPSRIEPRETRAAAAAASAVAPHARFFIAKNKSKITVRFDPPVSSRFLLLKLWSPSVHGNIDIQSVVAHGFAGPRFFPAQQMR